MASTRNRHYREWIFLQSCVSACEEMVKYLNSERSHTLRPLNNIKDAPLDVYQLLQTMMPDWKAMKNVRDDARPSCSTNPNTALYHIIRATTPTFQHFSFLLSPFSTWKTHLLWLSLLPVAMRSSDHDQLEHLSSVLLTMLICLEMVPYVIV